MSAPDIILQHYSTSNLVLSFNYHQNALSYFISGWFIYINNLSHITNALHSSEDYALWLAKEGGGGWNKTKIMMLMRSCVTSMREQN